MLQRRSRVLESRLALLRILFEIHFIMKKGRISGKSEGLIGRGKGNANIKRWRRERDRKERSGEWRRPGEGAEATAC